MFDIVAIRRGKAAGAKAVGNGAKAGERGAPPVEVDWTGEGVGGVGGDTGGARRGRALNIVARGPSDQGGPVPNNERARNGDVASVRTAVGRDERRHLATSAEQRRKKCRKDDRLTMFDIGAMPRGKAAGLWGAKVVDNEGEGRAKGGDAASGSRLRAYNK
ncbi:hypothetical protein THAOC_26435 [Thalassiosira oceanica]|uniref:Uncharacterized protein n=1 Tax=Thalassiosira oceanica TaxID=159749 RepID=K0RYT4_THAOC|nr:hypothetical protein THAOC_26435 [Thalassiosira oceanica]|eukprot:EJK54016.1 hypothetical protein THAOC_26435 [Thalassiosira oceanica]